MPNVGAPELIIILVIALIVLGPKKLPEVGRSVGRGHAGVQGVARRRGHRRGRAPGDQARVVLISPALLERIVEHASREAPNECCGLVGVRDGEAFAVVPAENTEASPFRFNVDGRVLLRAIDEFEEQGGELGAVYHSHTRSEPYPSQTDVTFAAAWPGIEWLIVGLAGGEAPEVRCFRIDDGDVEEVELT